MPIWSGEIKELEKLFESFKGHLPALEKELDRLITTDDENMVLVYARRCLEVVITHLCECELKRSRGTEPLKGIIDKLNKEEKVPHNIIVSMSNLNSLSAFGAHPKEFDPEQVKPVLNNLTTVIKWYLKYKTLKIEVIGKEKGEEHESERPEEIKETTPIVEPKHKSVKIASGILLISVIVVIVLNVFNIFNKDKLDNIRNEDGRISVAVMPFDNITGDSLYSKWQVGLQNLLINRLSNSEELSVRQSQTMYDILESTGQTSYASITPSIASEIALKLETNTYILGNIMKAGNKIRISAQLRDATTQEIYRSYEVDGNTRDDFFDITDSLSNLLKNYLEIQVLKQDVPYDYTSWAFTNSPEAYRYYLQSLNYSDKKDFKSAIELLIKVIDIDTSFLAAYDLLIDVYYKYGYGQQDYSQIEKSKQLLNKLLDWEIDKLSRIEQLSLKMTIANRIDKNPQEYIKNCKLILEYDPQQRMFWNSLGHAYSSIKQYEKAIEAFEKAFEISKQWGVQEKGCWNYTALGTAYHSIENHKKENDVYELGLSIVPSKNILIWTQAFCALSLGDTTEANKYIAKYISIGKNESFWSDETINHRLGHLYGKAQLLDEADIIWRETRQMEPQSTYHMRCHAEFLILNDIDIEEGLELVNRILEINPDYYDVLYFKGLGLYKQGHLEQALEILQIAWDKRFSYRHDHYLAIQKVKQALSNQNK